jgi:hypothetical protein
MDILLGMNWMTHQHVSLDISSLIVEINSHEHEPTVLYLPQQEYTNSCTYAATGIKLKDIPIVCEYPDVFPDDLPGMPPDRDIEFIMNSSLVQPLSLKGPVVCHPMSWLS